MIQASTGPWQGDAWQRILGDGIGDPLELLAAVAVPREAIAGEIDPAAQFPTRVPRPFVARMRRGDPDDPLLKQVLAMSRERTPVPGFEADPLAEARAGLAPGLLKKYHGRALLIAAGGCAINCRYCFRRHFPYDEHRDRRHGAAIEAIAADASITEVILSGGDPLMLKDPPLQHLVGALDAIAHVARIRVHTRLPVVIPERVTEALLDTLGGTRATSVVVVHVNHSAEIDLDVARAFSCLADAGVALFNQSVLLDGVNADVAVLEALSEKLFEHRVIPYYLHLPDRVAGTSHFFVDEHRARALHDALAARLPGYLVPRLAREEPGLPCKRVLS